MGFKSDIEIAREAKKRPIQEIGAGLGIPSEHHLPYGHDKAKVSQEFIDFMLSKIPRGRFVTVDEIANMLLWMASAENSFTTGAVFDLSGGRATY